MVLEFAKGGMAVRVFHVISGFENGGVETLILRLVAKMPKDVEFHIVAHEAPVPSCADRFRECGITVHFVPSRKKILHHQRVLYSLFKIYRPEVVHVHTTEWGALALSAAKKAGVPCRIQHSHAARREKSLLLRLAHTVFFAWARRAATDYFACGSDAARTAFGKQYAKARILKNGIDVRDFSYREEWRLLKRKELNIDKDQTVVGMVARFSPQKNHERALALFGAYLKKDPTAVLLLVGDGPLRAATERLAGELLPRGSVRFLGVRTDVGALYSAMDRFILPSRFEGLPITLVEATAAGLPAVVSSTVTREADLCGIVAFANTENEDDWVRALCTLLPDDRHAFAERVIAAGYALDISAKQLYDFYQLKK